MTKVLEYYCVTHIGKVRDNHEDNYLTCDGKFISLKKQKRITLKRARIITHRIVVGDKYFPAVFAIADGMGGHRAGEIASNTVVSELKGKIKSGRNFTKTLCGPVDTVIQYINDVSTIVNVKASTDYNLSGMGSTIVTLVFEQDGVTSVNVGDSRAYLFENGKLKQLSHDHTFRQQVYDTGIVKGVNYDMISYGKLLTRFVGMGNGLTEDITRTSAKEAYRDSQLYMICSDGLTDEVSTETIAKICSENSGNLKKTGKSLLNEALGGKLKKTGGCDNITFILIRCRDVY